MSSNMTPTTIGDHVRGRARNDERTEPGHSGGDGNTEHANVERENLRGIRPGDTLPGGADDKGVEVDAYHGKVSRSVTLRHAVGSGASRIGLEDVSPKTSKDCAPDETVATTDTLNYDKGKGNHAQRLEASVKTGGKQLGAGTSDAKCLENTRRVVCDDVDAGEALEEHESHADTHAVADTLLEELLKLLTARETKSAALLNLHANLVNFPANVRVLGRKPPQLRQSHLCLFEPVLAGQPARRLWVEQHADKQQHAGRQLQRERDDPLRLVVV
ncbi:hypothetical protein CRV24_000162 [Beauveria bassiana]|nr:hypothetical protein CRV24_000162 [Beauveria bassiana]KAH8721320.1 hypothetical protein HC256_001679 [Beauveria bassiana]